MISVVIITYNKVRSLKYCINSILNQSYKSYEVIIVDDGSTDNTRQFINSLQRKYNIIKYFRQKNKGRGAARNFGLKQAKGKIIAFTDDDCIAPQDWLKNIKNIFEKYPSIAAGGGAVINRDKNCFGESAYILNFSSWMPVGKKRYLNDTPTANIAYKKKDVQGLQFPVEYKDLDYEDSFFNHDLIRQGKRILFDPSIKVYHNPKINDYGSFLKNQRRKARSFLLRGYKIHGLFGKLLIRFKLLNLFCPRLSLIFLRCLRSPKYLYRFIIYFPLIFRGELERGLTMVNCNVR